MPKSVDQFTAINCIICVVVVLCSQRHFKNRKLKNLNSKAVKLEPGINLCIFKTNLKKFVQ